MLERDDLHELQGIGWLIVAQGAHNSLLGAITAGLAVMSFGCAMWRGFQRGFRAKMSR